MSVLLYAPAVSLVIQASSGTYDVSEDITAGTCTITENGVSTMSVRLLNRGRRYDRLFTPNDRFVLYLKRLTQLPIMTGYLDTVPFFTVWPRTVTVTGSSTLKALQYRFWDPGDTASYYLLISDSASQVGNTAYNDSGLALKSIQLATQVGGWPGKNIHFSSLPSTWINKVMPLYNSIMPDVMRESIYSVGGAPQGGALAPLQQGVTTTNPKLPAGPVGAEMPVSWASAVPASRRATSFASGGEWGAQMQWTYRLPDGTSTPGVSASAAEKALTGAKLMAVNPDNNQAVVLTPTAWGPIGPSGSSSIGVSSAALQALGIGGAGSGNGSSNSVMLAWVTRPEVALGPFHAASTNLSGTSTRRYANGQPAIITQAGPAVPVTIQASHANVAVGAAISRLGDPYVWGATGPNSFDCLAEGTLVTTSRGDVPIERVVGGDYVLTRKGYRKVQRAWLVRSDAETVVARVGDRELCGTPDHRVWTENRGWVGLGSLTTFDTVVLCPPNASSSTASPTTAIPTRIDPGSALTSSALAPCSTELSGSTTTGPYLLATRSTTRTATPSTTTSPTWSASRSGNTVSTALPDGDSMTMFALSAGLTSSPWVTGGLCVGSVPQSARENVSTVNTGKKSSVYDLSVEGEHEFFANGILVHNCSGLMMWAWEQAGVDITRTTYTQYAALTPVPGPSSNWLPGDLLFYRGALTEAPPGHVKMYLGNNRTIEAPQTGQNVRYATINSDGSDNYAGAFYGARRVSASYAANNLFNGGRPDPTYAASGAQSTTAATATPGQASSSLLDVWAYVGNTSPASMILTGYRALLVDTPLLPTFQAITNASMRSYANAPNGDIIAWFPDYFNQYGCLGTIDVQDIEVKDFTVVWSDTSMVTHQYVAGTMNVTSDISTGHVGGAVLLNNIQYSAGVATIDFPQILQELFNIPNDDPVFSTRAIYQRFGARPNYQGIGTIVSPLAEFWYALYLFQQNWASMFSASIPLVFLPEVYPGMILRIPSVGFQCYVEKVTHSWSLGDGGGFQTSVDVVAPSAINGAGLWGFTRGG